MIHSQRCPCNSVSGNQCSYALTYTDESGKEWRIGLSAQVLGILNITRTEWKDSDGNRARPLPPI